MFTSETLNYFVMGAFLGLTAGISPGPLLTLVVSETLKYNKTEGIKVALSPLITDLPIILLSLWVFEQLVQFDLAIGIIAISGGIFLAYMGFESVRTKGIVIANENMKTESLRKGIITNFLNPHPYLFWATIGAPTIIKANGTSFYPVFSFLLSFYILLIGSKLLIVFIVARSKVFIGNKTYVIIMQILGIVLFLFAFLFLKEGIIKLWLD